jgi:hypothetical protein
MSKNHKYFSNLWVMTVHFRAYLSQGLDPDPKHDPDVFERRIRIQLKIVRIRNNDFYFAKYVIPCKCKNEFYLANFAAVSTSEPYSTPAPF